MMDIDKIMNINTLLQGVIANLIATYIVYKMFAVKPNASL